MMLLDARDKASALLSLCVLGYTFAAALSACSIFSLDALATLKDFVAGSHSDVLGAPLLLGAVMAMARGLSAPWYLGQWVVGQLLLLWLVVWGHVIAPILRPVLNIIGKIVGDTLRLLFELAREAPFLAIPLVLVGNGYLVFCISERWPSSASSAVEEFCKEAVGWVLTGFGSGQTKSLLETMA